MNNNINNNNSSNNSVTTSGFSEMKRLDPFDFSSLKKRKTENLRNTYKTYVRSPPKFFERPRSLLRNYGYENEAKKKNEEEKLGMKNNEARKLRLQRKLTTFNLKATYKGKTSET